MTTIQVHLIMLALGIFAFLLLAGIYSKRKAYRSRSKPWLCILAGVAIVASPLSRFWRGPSSGIDLMTQSLLVSVICLLALLLVSLLLIPIKSWRRSRKMRNANEASATQAEQGQMRDGLSSGLAPIVINADTNNQLTADTNSALTNSDASSIDVEELPTLTLDTPANTPVVTQAQSMYDADTFHDPLRPDSNASDGNTNKAPVTLDKSRRNQPSLHMKEKQSESTSFSDHNESQQDHATLDAEILAVEKDAEQAAQRAAEKRKVEKVGQLKAKLAAEKAAKRAKSNETDQLTTRSQVKPAIESVLPKRSSKDNTALMDENISGSNAANDALGINAELNDQNGLDLSETEELFAEIRSKQTEVNLPDDKELKDATQRVSIDELDLESNLVMDEGPATSNKFTKENTVDDYIEEAEVVDVDDSNLEFGNDLTGEYSHPNESLKADTPVMEHVATASKTPMQPVPVPETLDDAMVAAKASAASLVADVTTLEDNIAALESMQDEQTSSANTSIKEQQSVLKQKDELLSSEDATRRAADSVIAAQNALIDRTKRQQAQAQSELLQERKRMRLMEREVERSRQMARTATKLARKAAIAQQETKNIAKREQSARLKSQESTRKAVTIARNAISALAAEERKHPEH